MIVGERSIYATFAEDSEERRKRRAAMRQHWNDLVAGRKKTKSGRDGKGNVSPRGETVEKGQPGEMETTNSKQKEKVDAVMDRSTLGMFLF